MTAVLDNRLQVRSTVDLARSFRERVSDWSDAEHVAQAAAELLRHELARPVVSIFANDPVSPDLLLVGAAPRGVSRPPRGSRRTGERRLLDSVLETGTARRSLNQYVEPDFVLSLPGETRSALGVPVLAGDRVLGVIHLEYPSPHTPSDSDEELAELIGMQLGAAWAHAGPHHPALAGAGDHRADRRLREGSVLAGISGALARADDYDAVFTRIAASVTELLGCGGALLMIRHRSRQMLEVVAGAGSLQLPRGTLVSIDGTRVGQVTRSGKAIDVPAVGAVGDPVLPSELGVAEPLDALIVPVTSGGRTCGVLLVADSATRDGYRADDVQLLQALADQAGAAEALRSIPALRQRISDASVIAEVGRAMTGTLGVDEVFALIVRAAEMLVGGRCAAVALLSDDRTHLTLAATSGSLRGREGAVLPTRETVVGWSARQGESLITDSLPADPRGWPLGENFGPAALVPLESRAQILGVLLVARGVGAASPSDEDLDALRKLAAYAAIALDNAHLYRQQTELSRSLRTKSDELEKAYADLATSQERLLISEKMAALGRLTAGIAHEINSPLGSILNCLQLATSYGEEYRDSATDPDVTPNDHLGIATDLLETLALAEEATRRVAQFVRTIKGQTRMDEEQVLSFDPAEEIGSTVGMLQHEIDGARIRIETHLERGLTLKGDPNKFAVVIQNLVSNAVDSYEDGSGVVRIRLRSDIEGLILEVEDEGSGIAEEIRPRIFDYLFTTKDIGRGTGLGLSLVHSIVTSNFHGFLDFRTEVGSGTTFVVTIPPTPEK